MPKHYEFRFNAQNTEFRDDGIMVVSYDGSSLAEEFKTCTLAEAVAYLPVFSAKIPVPHTAFLGMRYRSDRLPPGFNKAVRRVCRKGVADAAR